MIGGMFDVGVSVGVVSQRMVKNEGSFVRV